MPALNQRSLWRSLLVVLVVSVGVLYALPNLYGEDPAVQISSAARGPTGLLAEERARAVLDAAELPYRSVAVEEGRLLARFADADVQVQALDALRDGLGAGYTVALNLAQTTPPWLRSLGGQPMFLGLDLRGGVHFLMEVDMEGAVAQAETRYVSDLRTLLREERIRYLSIVRANEGANRAEASGEGEAGGVVLLFADLAERQRADRRIRREYPDLLIREEADRPALRLTLDAQEVRDTQKFALQQNITTLRNRVNELGVAEPVIQQQGANRIVVQLPGVQDTARAKNILGAAATLEFRLVAEGGDPAAAAQGRVPPGAALYRDRAGAPVLLRRQVLLTGDAIIDAASGIDQQGGSPAVFITLDGKGARRMAAGTRDNIGRRMAVVFIETKMETRRVDGELQRERKKSEKVINVAVIRDQLSKRFQITGLDSSEEARDLALLLRAGALAAPTEIIEERTVGPSMGRENIERGMLSVVIGFVLVLLFMALYYRLFGLIADLALTLNLALIIAVLSLLQATLTLPGIAGIVLTVGMAVDANVLIFERIREELRAGSAVQAAIHAGYEKAFATIADANITTFIAAIVLFALGAGPVKGFAVTLAIGIVTSMFTAIMGTRAVVNWIYGGRRVRKLSI